MQVTVSFDLEVDAVEDVLDSVAGSYGYSVAEALGYEDDGDDDEDAMVWGGWTAHKMRRYVSNLKPQARRLLRVIVEGAPQISVADVQDACVLSGQEYGGAMSSFGHAANRTRGVKDKPFTKVSMTYQMDPAVAELARGALDELEQ